MITNNLIGGLGNQLFQIATTIALAIRNHHTFCFDYTLPTTGGMRKTYWDTFLKSCQAFTDSKKMFLPSDESGLCQSIHIKHIDHHYKPLDQEIPVNVETETSLIILEGYFQSYKYFEHEITDIYRIWNIHEQQILLANEFPELIKPNRICMHFRIGDYRYLVNVHPLLDWTYYRDSLQTMFHKINDSNNQTRRNVVGQRPGDIVYYLCEDCDIEDVNHIIYKLQEEYPSCKFHRIKAETDWQEMLLMSLCQHHIIANSSFSWWSAYMRWDVSRSLSSQTGDNETMQQREHISEGMKMRSIGVQAQDEWYPQTDDGVAPLRSHIVCYPSIWFGKDAQHHYMGDMFPSSWTCIETINKWC